MKIGIETESCHLAFQHGRMDIFSFIELAAELGLDGVQINVIPDLNLNQVWGTLARGDDAGYLRDVRSAIESHDFFCEVDARGTTLRDLGPVLQVSQALGARTVRTYVRFACGFDRKFLAAQAAELRRVVPLLDDCGLRLAIENHEYETISELLALLEAVGSSRLGLCFDTGNSMMAWEDPYAAAALAAPSALTVHFKDHSVVHDPEIGQHVVCGVPLGEGNLDLARMYGIVADFPETDAINMEVCYPYCATFKRPPGAGGVHHFEGPFAVLDPPFPLDLVAPMGYYYPHTTSARALEVLLEAQDRAVREGAALLLRLRAAA